MRLFLFGILLFVSPFFVQAQIQSAGFIDMNQSIVLSPSYPSPQESFTATLNDYGGATQGATIEWSYNDGKLDWAFNKRSVTLAAPEAGNTGKIQATLTKPNGGIQTITHTIVPLYLDVIIEPQTHVPSFFKGRALPSPGSTINAAALVSADSLLTDEYLYTWRLNNVALQGGPLRGGNRISFTMPQDTYSTLSVTVTRLDGSIIAKRTISVPSVSPSLVFYEVNTLYGVMERALKSPFPLIGNSTTLRVEPYYLDSEVFNNPDVATWSVDSNTIPTGNNYYEITLERTSQTGLTDVTFRVQSTTELLQGTKSTLTIDVL